MSKYTEKRVKTKARKRERRKRTGEKKGVGNENQEIEKEDARGKS